MADTIDIVFDGPPGHESGRFVEVEDSSGRSVRVGEWIQRADGYWVLRIPANYSELRWELCMGHTSAEEFCRRRDAKDASRG